MKRLFLIAVMIISACVTLSAQGATIKGTVVDSAENPIIGATVKEVGTTNAVITDLEGRFTLTVSKVPTKIEVSCIGYKTKTYVLRPGDNGELVLEEDTGEE